MTDLCDLLERLEAATGPDDRLDASIEFALDPEPFALDESPTVTASLDAALGLVDRAGFDKLAILLEALSGIRETSEPSVDELARAVLIALVGACISRAGLVCA